MIIMVHGKRINIGKEQSESKVIVVAVMPNGERVPVRTLERLMFVRRLAHGWETEKGNPCKPNKVNHILHREFGVFV